MRNLVYGGYSSIGRTRNVNEDYINVFDIGEDVVLAVVADGKGANATGLLASSVAATELRTYLELLHGADASMLRDHAPALLRCGLQAINKEIGAFKIANEELYSGFWTCLTCALIFDDGKTFIAHTGNTRAYLLRENKKRQDVDIRQITKDETKAQELLEAGQITQQEYYAHPDRLILTNSLGLWSRPEIQVIGLTLREKDILMLSTDGIHYAYIPEAMKRIILSSKGPNEAAKALTEATAMVEYPDNASALVLAYGM